MKKSIIYCALLSLFSFSAIASEWNNLLAGNADNEYFFDAESVNKTKDVVTVWIKYVKKHSADSDGSWSTAVQWRINCARRTIQPLSMSTYAADGKFIKSFPNAGTEESTAPDSMGAAFHKVACLADFPKNTPATKDHYFKIKDNDIYAATRRFVELEKSQVDNAPK